MNYSNETIENLITRISDSIPRAMLLCSDSRERMEKARRESMKKTLTDLVLTMNRECGSNRRKKVEAVGEELSRRDIVWTWTAEGNDMHLVAMGKECSLHVRYDHGLEIALSYDGQNGRLGYDHCTAREDALADLVELVFTLDVRTKKSAEQRRMAASRDQMLSDIEFPSIKLDVAKYMEPREIRYELRESVGYIFLEVQIVKEIWMKKAMSLETLEEDLSIIPYLILRPDCIKRDGRGFKIFRKYDWDK